MKKEERKGLFGGLFGTKKEKGGCCNIELEEITEEKDETTSENNPVGKEKSSCCG